MKLADVSLLVAMSDAMHTQHALADRWRKENEFATCPITELGLVRVLMATGTEAEDAFAQLASVKKKAGFVPCDAPGSVIAGKVTGHKQTTDAYLLELARLHKSTLHTLDAGIKGAVLVS